METPQDPDPTIPQRLVRGFLALVGVGVLYAASFGPVLVLSFRTGDPWPDTCLCIYRPLLFIAAKTSTGGLLDGYFYWWITVCKPKDGYKADPFGP